MSRPVICILGDEGDDPSGEMFEKTMIEREIPYFWMSRRDLLADITYRRGNLASRIRRNPYALGIDPTETMLRPDSMIREAHAYLPVGATLPSYGSLITHALAEAGLLQPNEPLKVDRASDKWATHLRFVEAGVPVPRAYLVESSDDAVSAAGELKFPVVIKEPMSYGGKGVRLARNRAQLAAAVAEFDVSARHPLMIEQYIECDSTDTRIVVVDGRVAGSVRRHAQRGDFRANLTLGGSGEAVRLTAEERRLALAMADALELDFVGIDIARSTKTMRGRHHLPAGSLFGIEGNPTPGIRGLFAHTGVDVTSPVLDHLLERVAEPAFVA